MQRIIHHSARTAATLALLSLIAAAAPVLAADADASRVTVILAATDPAPMPAAAPAPAETVTHTDNHVEARIKDLHKRLGITAAQEDDWTKVAGAMRDNAMTMSALTQARTEKAKAMTAIEDLKSYEEIAKAHADGIEKFTPVFETLYNSMSDDQKKQADAMFRARSHKMMRHMDSKAG